MPSTDRVRPDHHTTNVVGARIGAQLVDVVIMFVQGLAVGLLLVLLVRPERAQSARGFFVLALLTLPLYGGLLEAYWNGQTVGKRLLGIKVVDDRGRDPSVGQAFVRNVPAVVLFGWLPTVVALASIATSDHRQRLFDVAADTYVVEAPR